ncbi:uncharacterized protein MYCGRDRAFT_97991 [Zymoseptoria tritici IPO323]|uniref:Uncharacterized protein n=1 Tax=Zymoseptoria tritici (strain CBS 115943 / IPO323) TaxID=336722 RepID=F9XS01_ZYMTI|nr:uncharacterized protein MYCGRDRAFT_97991 [Zymoseptoria tritici IPO323]EGP82013.1 hypothetical protein MYCGRDRAFT_97991 [Zymoseptoria tritici IPO323]
MHWSPGRTSGRVSEACQIWFPDHHPYLIENSRRKMCEPDQTVQTREEVHKTIAELETRPAIPHLLSNLVLDTQQPKIDPDTVSYAYLMVFGVASYTDRPLAHADQLWFAVHMPPDVWTIHKVQVSSPIRREAGGPVILPRNLIRPRLRPLEQPHAERLNHKRIPNAMLDWGQPAQIMSHTTSSRIPSAPRLAIGTQYNIRAFYSSLYASPIINETI